MPAYASCSLKQSLSACATENQHGKLTMILAGRQIPHFQVQV